MTPENIVIVAGAAKESAACSAQGHRVQLVNLWWMLKLLVIHRISQDYMHYIMHYIVLI